MKNLIISEQERNRILKLYEQSTSGTTQQSSDDKEVRLSVIWKYRNELTNIVKMLISIFPVVDMEEYRNWKSQYCTDDNSKLNNFLVSKMTPIYGVIDDFFIKLKTDMKVGSVNEAIKILYNTFNSSVFKGIIKLIGTLVEDDEPIAVEIVNGLQNHLRTKYGEDGALFSSVLSGVLGAINIQYTSICEYDKVVY